MKKLLSLLAFVVFNLTFFSQQTWTFTNANSSGNQGPTQSQVNIAYSGTNLDNNVTVNTQGIQEWLVPASGTYRILAKGAEGGDGGSGTLSPGKGASIEGEVFLTQGTVLKVVVGQKPSGTSSGGGGGTYVIKPPYNTSASVLIVAGGGGGAPGNCCSNTTHLNGVDGVTSQTGTDAVGGGCSQGTGGSNGNGGNFASGLYSAGGGGGFFTHGGDGEGFGGNSFINNSLGGLGDTGGGDGGFGGGGGAGHVSTWIGGSGGGGGGYSGGGAACGSLDWGSGGGGGSFNAGINQNNIAGANSGHGSVVFTLLYSVSINETSSISCFGSSDGILEATPIGGDTPYTYSWSGPGSFSSSSQTISGLSAGNYSVTVTDNNNHTTNQSYTLTEPASLVASSVADSNTSCNGASDAGATASATGGTMPYTYSWSNAASTASITGVTAGTYSVTVTDNNGCFDTASITLTEPASLVASSVADSNVSCNGAGDAGATASATGGTAPYNYLWSNAATTASITGVAAGTYSVTITDNNGCFDTASITLTEPASLVASSVADSNVSCNGSGDAGATASATGGTMPYTYSWSNAATTASITGVATGTYSVTITDDNGCFDSASITLTEPASLVASSVADSNVSCNGASDAGATASATGGTAPYNYLWSNAATTASITGVAAGTYTVTITDDNGCTATSSSTISEPTALGLTVSVNDSVSCPGVFDGEITSVVTGGTAPYNYQWNNAATTASISNLSVGTYVLTVTDDNGCTIVDSVSLEVGDDVDPVVATQNIIVYLDNSGSASITTTDIDNGSSDNCSIDNLSLDVTNFTCADTGLNTVTLTATDVSGNTNSATATVTVEDTTSPVVATQNVTVYLDNSGSASITTTDIDNGSSDNCSIDNLSLDITSFTCADTGSNTVTLTATDVSGNTSSATATVTVEDTTSPVVATQNIIVYLDNSGSASITTTDI
ncbi:MAG: SprB repeat-containing protein, partial [Salibacter sp.]|uniref:beta strand repeat-containing protein n=1 Tax=Salibacter sp. TaxID=2010995 RepID=UPI002870139C